MDLTAHFCSLDDPGARAAWGALLERSPQRTAFASPGFAEAAGAAFGLEARFLLVRRGEEPLAGAVVFEKRRGPYRLAVVPPYTQFSPLLMAGPPDEGAAHARATPLEPLLAAVEARCHAAWLNLHPSLADARPFQWRGWRAEPAYTYRLAPSAPEGLTAGWSAATRRAFQRSAAAYRVEEDASALAEVIHLNAGAYARRGGRLPVSPERLRALAEPLLRSGVARVFTATASSGDGPEAGVVLLGDDRTAHYWIAGSRPGPAMTVLVGRLLARLHEEGVPWFDFVGANTPSIAEFKRRFGPTLAPYYRVSRIARPELRLAYALRAG